jgi:hypothetical protein
MMRLIDCSFTDTTGQRHGDWIVFCPTCGLVADATSFANQGRIHRHIAPPHAGGEEEEAR